MNTSVPSKKRPWWQFALIIVGTLLLLIFGIALYLQAKWRPLLHEKLSTAVIQSSDSLYRLDYKKANLNLLRGTVVFHDLQLIPDSQRYERLKTLKKAPAHLYRIQAKQLRISRAQILNAYFNKHIKLNSISLIEPKVWMHYTRVGRAPDTVKNKRSLYEIISGSLKVIQIGEIRLLDADFEYYNGKRLSNKINRLNVALQDILIDSLSQTDSTRINYVKNIKFNFGNYESLTKDKLYKIKIDSVNGDIHKNKVTVKGFKLIPQLAELPFSRQFKTQKDRYDLNFEHIQLLGFDFMRMHQEGEIRARKIAVGPGKVAVFLNRELPPPAIDKGKNFPHNALKKLDMNTKIDSLVLSQVQIAYTEYSPDTKAKGTLHLGNLSGAVINLTNDSLSLSQNHIAQAKLKTSLMNKGNLNVQINFNLIDPLASFTYSGGIKNYNLAHLNSMAKPLGQVDVESGYVESLTFSMRGNMRGASGTVNFTYKNLKANLMKKDEQGVTKKKGLLSFVANKVLIKDTNPLPGKPVRTAQVQWARVPQASFFNLMWKSIFLGIRDIVGIGMIPMKNPGEK